jgi:hypothetical protein
MPTEKEILEALQQALGVVEVPRDEALPRNSLLGEFRLSDFEDHARGIRPFSADQLSEIARHPVRRKLLTAFEREYAREGGLCAKLREWIQSWRDEGGLLRPIPVGAMKAGGANSAPAYPLIIEREGVFLEESSIQMVFAPTVTEAGQLVFKVAFSATIAELVALPSIRAELSVIADFPEQLLGRVEVTDARPYIKLPLPPEVCELPQWREIDPGAALPFALILHLSNVRLEAATL